MSKPKKLRRSDATGRSVGGDPHVRLHRWLLKSPAYCHASLAARALLVELYALHNGVNNGDLFLSVRDAGRRLGVGKNLAHEAFRELVAKGFIAVHIPGAFHLKARHATVWRLTEFPCGSALPTKDFMTWQPTSKKQNPVPVAGTNGVRRGDRGPPSVPVIDTDSPPDRDREGKTTGADGPPVRDTDSLPGEGARSAKPWASAARSAPDAGEDRDFESAGAAAMRLVSNLKVVGKG